MISQGDHINQTGNRAKITSKIATSNHLAPDIGSGVDLKTLEKKITRELRSGVGNGIAMVKTGVHEAILAAIGRLVITIVEIAMG